MLAKHHAACMSGSRLEELPLRSLRDLLASRQKREKIPPITDDEDNVASQCRFTWSSVCFVSLETSPFGAASGLVAELRSEAGEGPWSWSSWEAVSFNLLTLMFRYSCQNQKCMARSVTLKLYTAKQIKLSESHHYSKVWVPETECWRCDWVEGLHLSAIRLHLREACAHRSQVWTWLGGERRGRQFVIIWVTRCRTDVLPRWPPRRALKW